MAKRKSKSKTRKRSKPMATRKRRRRRSSSTSKLRTALRSRSKKTGRRRRRKRGLSDGMTTGNLMKSVKSNFGGAVGGAAKVGIDFIPLKWYWRALIGYTGAVGATMMGAPNIGSGLSGATTHDLLKRMLAKFNITLNDDADFEDADYVDENTLSETGMEDENGNPIVMDDDDIAYALQDNGELIAIGDGRDMTSTSMLPLQDPYALSANPYALSDSY